MTKPDRIAEYARDLDTCAASITDDMVCPTHNEKLRPAVVRVYPDRVEFEARCYECLRTPDIDPGSTKFT